MCHGINIVWIDLDGGISNYFRQRRCIGGDDRCSTGHSLYGWDAKALKERGESEDIGHTIERNEFKIAHASQEAHLAFEFEVGDQLPGFVVEPALAASDGEHGRAIFLFLGLI